MAAIVTSLVVSMAASPGVCQGPKVPAQKAKASAAPPHMLVVFKADAETPRNEELAKHLGVLFEAGWLVSVERPDGSLTEYESSRTDLAAALGPSSSPRAVDATRVVRAIDQLVQFPGWTQLVVVALPPRKSQAGIVSSLRDNNTDLRSLRKQQKAQRENREAAAQWLEKLPKPPARIQVIDGGVMQIKSFENTWTHAGNYGADNGDEVWQGQVRFTANGIDHEVNWKQALANTLTGERLARTRFPAGAGAR